MQTKEGNDTMDEGTGAAGGATIADAQDEVAALRAALEASEAEVARLKDERLRALAEVENTRRRAARDREDASQYAISAFARDLLAVADNLERAIGSVTPEARQSDPQVDALMNGIEATQRSLQTTLARHGIQPIAAHGAPFDPHLHEAMFELPDASVPHGTIVQVLEPGYTIHGRTLRPARVGIARGGPKAASSGGEATEQGSRHGGGAAYAQTEPAEATPGSRLDERS